MICLYNYIMPQNSHFNISYIDNSNRLKNLKYDNLLTNDNRSNTFKKIYLESLSLRLVKIKKI